MFIQTVICGHTHVPKEKEVQLNGKTVRYLNYGDWVEHFTAAEYNHGAWRLFYQNNQEDELQPDELEIPGKSQLYQNHFKRIRLFKFYLNCN